MLTEAYDMFTGSCAMNVRIAPMSKQVYMLTTHIFQSHHRMDSFPPNCMDAQNPRQPAAAIHISPKNRLVGSEVISSFFDYPNHAPRQLSHGATTSIPSSNRI